MKTKNYFLSSSKFSPAPLSLILTNNLKVIFLMLAGSITFGLSTFINLIFNGFNVGVLIGSTFLTNEPLKLILALILPHGIFEIPAILISAIAGFKISYILIVIAAFVEVYVTSKIANYILT
ncbi:stage II sporulation protein M [Methanocaldococcus indicus]|uniref:stage II sporulation protein M n=1 Tax=Methanocaldococcus indicus TaxID=213231 RepID=UPI003C6CF4E7